MCFYSFCNSLFVIDFLTVNHNCRVRFSFKSISERSEESKLYEGFARIVCQSTCYHQTYSGVGDLLSSSFVDRQGNKISLTKAGELLLKHSEKILDDYKQLEYEMHLLHNEYIGELKLGASTTIAQYVLPPLLANFIAKFPQINLSLINGNSRGVEAALQEHRIDLGLVEGIFRLPNLKYTPFLQDELVAVVHTQSKLAVTDEITPEDLLNIPLVLRERGSGTLDVFERALLQHNLKLSSLNVLMYLGSTESIKLFLEHTDCMGIVSIRSVHKELVAGNLRVVEIKGMPMLREFNFVQLQGQEGGLSQVFMRFAGHHSKSL